MRDTINYLINLLAGGCGEDFSSIVGYTANQDLFPQYKIIILPSSFFDESIYGKSDSLPHLPLQTINDIPLLFGSPKVEQIENTLVIHADIIASAYFLLTRYEEFIRKDCRDIHGRFPGKESLPYRAGFIHRPIIEEYGRLLQDYLKECGINISKKPHHIAKVYLTHDVDQAFQYRSLRGFIGGLFKHKIKDAVKYCFGDMENDPLFTFPWILEQNQAIKKSIKNVDIQSIFFFKSTIKHLPQDKPCYNPYSTDIQQIFRMCDANDTQIGLHSSYFSGDKPQYIHFEKELLEKASGKIINYNRHHYLRSKEPIDTKLLFQAGITDDFTMGYADVAGFRLGTCKAVKWINPQTKKLSSLNLHPLTIMDVTLSDERYMNLDYTSALNYATNLIDKVKEFDGELVLLWHNTSFAGKSWHKNLYSGLLEYIKTNATNA